ncbi:MAG: hypothetical protein A3D96_07490 [Chlamydiae bacterium RIFCSPHIGHO2_12_FULL_44_59]|nr:MAG: hypothetical protein A2796_06800 [Chlamydiae bacterium RIFCSPHIGHO2_01_FULL_44_39]OGN59567.1 MAG: hypothetical protein A3D96_07490 [Chlamydiae bacterium RIFCSPHIGHO2_12_FULL_44_59]OGN67313.1 MAG: hypothetical protein A2978_03320 [Chlamydiae bacterium RIFCSPLOWO2_01_FULL_44_52]OGN68739.1 MAG: hypothetical protein A3I67_03050 [Chlamydiae bacterium RIFCSPLOWO2_02_FULL_45_22]OGN69255.1 MAG: hypothetical protein A3F79_04835 [Chlamydiae bacterium RIFCSPLOWO2_12_FULL_45_20]
MAQNVLYSSSSSEKYYVLENAYQQLVFTDRGGSLAEINLPLRETSPQSIVREIDFDRQILKNSPQNNRFPLHSYTTYDGASYAEGRLGGYYPLLRRGLNGSTLPSEYYALNVVGEDPRIAGSTFRVTRFEKNLIEFQGSLGQATLIKTYSFPAERKGPYCFHLDLRVEGDPSGLWLSSGIPDVEIVANSYSPQVRIQTTDSRGSDVDTIKLPKNEPNTVRNISPNWISNNNGFFGLILDPITSLGTGYRIEKIPGQNAPTRLSLIDARYDRFPPSDYPGYATNLPLQTGTTSFRIFAGPYDHHLLKELDQTYDDPAKNYNPHYTQAITIQGWFSFISQPFSKFLFYLMSLFHSISRSWAVSIILLTIALRAMMYPLNAWSIRSGIKTQELAPKVKAIENKYKKDPAKTKIETMNLYRQEGVNPLTGCLPLLLTMPFLLGMFYLLKSSFPLRGALFIPGWIDDLSAPDVLFSWGQPLWFIGNEFHFLPILMGLTMYLQQKFTSKLPKDVSQLSDTQKQQKMMGNMMVVIFTVMFYNFPSGLNLYFMISTLLGVAQQAWMTKKRKAQPKKA